MDFKHDERGFFLRITSLAELREFVAIIRGDKVDEAKLRAMTRQLKDSAEKLNKAVKEDGGSKRPATSKEKR